MWARGVLNRLAGAGINQLRCCNNTFYGRTSPGPSLVQRSQYSSETPPELTPPVVCLNPPDGQEPYTLTKEQEMLITAGDPEKKLKLSELLLRLYVRRDQGGALPVEVKLADFGEMLLLTGSRLNRYLNYLGKRHFSARNEAIKKRESALQLEALRKAWKENEGEHAWLDYRINQNSLFPRLMKSNVSRFFDAHALKASQFAQKIFIDCSYDSLMDNKHIKHTAKQLVLCYTYNRKNRRPFALNLCNLDADSKLMYYLRRLHPQIEEDAAVFFHSASYLDLFEKKNLVYLSPHSHNVLEYNPNDAYILGAHVDMTVGVPISNKKAFKEKIRCAALPIRNNISWKRGSKCLCIHQCFGALLDAKNTGDWAAALSAHIPQRKMKSECNQSIPKHLTFSI